MTDLQTDNATFTSEPTSPGSTTPKLMRAARYHQAGEPFSVDHVEKPSPRPTDVLVQVKACGVVPNLVNVLHLPPFLHHPTLPATYGLDPAGVVVETGSQVHGIEVGDRVYVNPLRYCGSCRSCRMGRFGSCPYVALNGYFGVGPKSRQMLDDHPHGGYAEFMTAPQYSLVKLPENLSFDVAARWGYLGTGYSALRRAGVNMSTTVLINGISGTLGLGAALFALALGAPTILGTGRNTELLEKVKALAPDRIHVLSVEGEVSVADWARSLTGGDGVEVVIDALPTGTPADAFLAALAALAGGGTHVNVGGVLEDVPINMFNVMNNDQRLLGSFWFSATEGQEMADLAGSGGVDLGVFEHEVFGLAGVNEALAAIGSNRRGGFLNCVIAPED